MRIAWLVLATGCSGSVDATLVRPAAGSVQVSPFHPVSVQAPENAQLSLRTEAGPLAIQAERVGEIWWLTPDQPLPFGQFVELAVSDSPTGHTFTTADPASRDLGTLTSLMADVDTARAASGSEAHVPPPDADLERFAWVLEQMLDGDFDVDVDLETLGYRWDAVQDTGRWRIAVWEPSPETHGGAYVFDFQSPRALVLQAPHPEYDTATGDQATAAFLELEAAALFVSGTHRCANAESSGCDGTTSACGSSGPFRISDAAHYEGSFFQVAHETANTAWADSIAVQLHGFGWDGSEPAAYVSDGTQGNEPASIANTVRDALNQTLPTPYTAASCADDSDGSRMCGTTNTQGRFSNDSVEVCQGAASIASGRFVHVEQARDLRLTEQASVTAALDTLQAPAPDLR